MSNEQVSLCAFVIAFYTNLFLKWMQFKYDKELPNSICLYQCNGVYIKHKKNYKYVINCNLHL